MISEEACANNDGSSCNLGLHSQEYIIIQTTST